MGHAFLWHALSSYRTSVYAALVHERLSAVIGSTEKTNLSALAHSADGHTLLPNSSAGMHSSSRGYTSVGPRNWHGHLWMDRLRTCIGYEEHACAEDVSRVTWRAWLLYHDKDSIYKRSTCTVVGITAGSSMWSIALSDLSKWSRTMTVTFFSFAYALIIPVCIKYTQGTGKQISATIIMKMRECTFSS